MKTYISLILIIAHFSICKGQDVLTLKIDSFTQVLKQATQDTIRLTALEQLGQLWQYKDLSKSTHYIEEGYELAQKLNLKEPKLALMFQLAYNYMLSSDAPKSIKLLQELTQIIPPNTASYQTTIAFLALTYKDMGDYDNALSNFQQAFELNERLQKEGKAYDERGYLGAPVNLAEVFEKTNRLDSALYYAEMSYQRLTINPAPFGELGFQWEIPWTYGIIESRLNRDTHAVELYFQGLKEAKKQGYNIGIESIELSLANHYNKMNRADSAILYATHAFESARRTPTLQVVSEAGFLLKKLYKKQKNYIKALYYYDIAHVAKDSIVNVEKLRQVQALTLKEERRLKEIEEERTASQNRLKQYSLLGGLLLILGISLFLYRLNRQKQQLNEQLVFQKNEIEALNDGLEQKVAERTAELKKALDEVQTAFNKGQTTERRRVSADLHDEIGSALSTIAIFSDITKSKAQQSAPELVNELERIGTKSRDMIQTMRDTIWTLNEDSPQSVWERMQLSGLETLNAKNIDLNWQLPLESDLPDLPFNTKRNLFLAYKEAINNIVKHAEATSVSVEGMTNNADFILKIRDNGKGFDKNTIKKEGNGLHNFEKRMMESGGTVAIESAINEGTCITFTVPIIPKIRD